MRKTFTLFTAALLTLAANASLVTWSGTDLSYVSILHNEYVDQEYENTVAGITATISTTGYGEFMNNRIVFDDAEGTLTFTSSVGNIGKIVILINNAKALYGTISSDGWSVYKDGMNIYNYNGTDYSKYIIWENAWDAPAQSAVSMTSSNLYTDSVAAVLFFIEPTDFAIDLRSGQLGTDQTNSTEKYLILGGSDPDDYYPAEYGAPARYDAYLYAARYNGSQHGYEGLKVKIPVTPGNYKVTLGTCQYGSGAGTVDDNYGTQANFNQNTGVCYHQNTTENVVSATFTMYETQIVEVTCGQYTPYFAFQKLSNEQYTITFDNDNYYADGNEPYVPDVAAGESFTIPVNKTLYYDGFTLTGWVDDSDMSDIHFYAIGESVIPTGDMTLHPNFRPNSNNLLDASNDVTVKWEFGEANGAPSMYIEHNSGFLVAQATVDGEKQDVKLSIGATSSVNAKFDNYGRNDKWAQVNQGTYLSIPGKEGAVVEANTYNEPSLNTLFAESPYSSLTGSSGNYVATYISSLISTTQTFYVADNNYYSYLQVTYPGSSSSATGIENTVADGQPAKRLIDGNILIFRGDKVYSLMGEEVR